MTGPPRKTRVLVVDDAVVVRRMVTDVLAADADIEVVGAAANGRIALQKLTQVNPDVITLDVEMPEMNGLETLTAIRQTHPMLPVIMFSTLTARGAAETLDALSRGASDYVTKPANVGSVATAQQRIREELIPKIKALCSKVLHPKPAARPIPVAPPVPAVSSLLHPQLDIVAIGVSTGGPNALAQLIPALPEDFPVPIVIVQHMPPMFTRLLAERLNAQSKLTVAEAQGGEVIRPGLVLIAPGNYHMTLKPRGSGYITALNQDPQENSCRPAVDVLFRSVASCIGSAALGVILTGMGQDGLHGSEEMHRSGGRIIVQDEASSVVWGMPGFVAQAGLADSILPLDQMAREIVRRTARRSVPVRLGGRA